MSLPGCAYIFPLYLGIDVKKSRETGPELLLDLFFAAFESVHGDARFASGFQFDWG
jgi:hypothetical protein